MQQNLRAGFPFFSANPGIVYLDSGATALKPQSVVDALTLYTARESVNIHRGVYRLSQRATDTVEQVRKQATQFVSTSPTAVAVFTKGTTEGLNLAAHVLTSPKSRLTDFFKSYASTKPPAILLSDSEHHANIVPWQIFAAERGYKLLYIPVDGEGNFNPPENFLSEIEAAYSLRIVSLSLQSNVTGIIHDLAPYREAATRSGAAFVVDAAQAVIHAPEKIQSLKPDFISYSAHKIFGPTGIGALVAEKAVLDACDVYQGGGGMISVVEREKSTYIEAPGKFEAGTQPVGEIYAFGKALEFSREYQEVIHHQDADLLSYADERFRSAGVRYFGVTAPQRSPIYSFEIAGVHAHDTGTLLDEQDICVRAGHHCCQLLMHALGTPATARASFAVYNTRDDVDRLMDSIGYVKKIFRK